MQSATTDNSHHATFTMRILTPLLNSLSPRTGTLNPIPLQEPYRSLMEPSTEPSTQTATFLDPKLEVLNPVQTTSPICDLLFLPDSSMVSLRTILLIFVYIKPKRIFKNSIFIMLLRGGVWSCQEPYNAKIED